MDKSADKYFQCECAHALQPNAILSVVWTAHAMSKAARVRVEKSETRSKIVQEQDSKRTRDVGPDAEGI